MHWTFVRPMAKQRPPFRVWLLTDKKTPGLSQAIGFTAQVLSDSALRAAGAEGEIDRRDYQLAFVMARHT